MKKWIDYLRSIDLFIFKNKNNKNCIERECQEVSYLKDHPFDRYEKDEYNYLCKHNKKNFVKIVEVHKYVNIIK